MPRWELLPAARSLHVRYGFAPIDRDPLRLQDAIASWKRERAVPPGCLAAGGELEPCTR
jgi:hypothetical protein